MSKSVIYALENSKTEEAIPAEEEVNEIQEIIEEPKEIKEEETKEGKCGCHRLAS